MALPAWQEWRAAALKEPWVLPQDEVDWPGGAACIGACRRRQQTAKKMSRMCIDYAVRETKNYAPSRRTSDLAVPPGAGLKAGSPHLSAGSCHHAISRYRFLFGCPLRACADCPCRGSDTAADPQDTPKNDVKGLFLLTDYPAVSAASGHHLDRQSAPAELRAAARAAGAVGRRRAAGLDRDPDRRRSAGRRRRCRRPTPASRSSCGSTCPRKRRSAPPISPSRAKGATTDITLPIAVTMATDLPAKLTLTPQLPGPARQFEIDLRISAQHQERERQEAARRAGRPRAAEFRRHLHRAIRQPGAQRASARSRPVEGRQAQGQAAEHGRRRQVQGHRRSPAPRTPSVTTDLGLDITGQPKLDITGREGLLSTRASAGVETSVPILVTNTGTAPAEDIELSGSAPSGWKVTFEPKTIDRIAPNENKEVQALITPTAKAIAGDYVATLRAVRARRVRRRRPSASRSRPRRCGASSAPA